MLGFLQHLVDAHTAKIGIGGSDFKTGVEVRHLMAGKCENGIDAKFAAPQRLGQRPGIRHIERQRAHARSIELGDDAVDTVRQQVRDDQ